ncbi:hypothetical protein Acor_24070 [Acrocarpospora corrugata]|uniref:Cupin type-2 domain-containing protein n=1 Tax=Acrocarpospora corrugata TaxID=35763 RepID=A0A5M3VV12_9ACTN|nr:cupin domain-containing protein [Acrocarpospora corrugata]GES00344.1 hypothetical protein Acor_24070 [Acrocarpospora corrugata]
MGEEAAVRPYVRGGEEGEALWFLGNLVTIKASGAETGGRVMVAESVNPPGFAPPVHRHLAEDELFYLLAGTARFLCDGESFTAGCGDFVLLPMGLAHSFVVGPDEPLRAILITAPSGFEGFVADVGTPALERRLPPPAPAGRLAGAAARHGIEILGPPPT